MSIAESTPLSDLPSRPAAETTRLILEMLPPSGDPEVTFTALADALVSTGRATGVTVELINRNSLWRVHRPAAAHPVVQLVPTQPLPQTQALFAGDGGAIRSPDFVAVAIQASAVASSVQVGPGPDFLGALICEFSARMPEPEDVETLRILVMHAIGVINHERTEAALTSRAENLKTALASNRQIGVAIGVLCGRHRVTPEQSFEILKIASQNTNRKLRDLAAEVVASIDPQKEIDRPWVYLDVAR